MNLFLPSDPRPLHFVGIAGAGMSALALLALRRGVAVSGSDRAPEGAPDLPGLGAKVLHGHDARFVDGARAVIVSAAIAADHPEVLRARELGLPVVARKRALADLVGRAPTVAIAGTHGKTTTTVMAAEALAAAGFDPTALAGGRVEAWHGNTRVGGDALFVVEADEYDQALLELHPTIAVVGNVEPEHLECYGGRVEALETAFAEFAGRAPSVLIGLAGAGCDRVAAAVVRHEPDRPRRLWRFGQGSGEITIHEPRLTEAGSEARIALPGGTQVDLRLRVPGLHNVLNATAALGVVLLLGGDVRIAAEALARFDGVERRFERRGEVRGVAVVDDYAHHPTELRATLAAARQAFPGRRIVAVFQPHLYSRTAVQAPAMGAALAMADLVWVAEVYAAREAPLPGVSGAQVADAVRSAGGTAVFEPSQTVMLQAVTDAVQAGDVVLTLGAGDITSFGPLLLKRLAVG